ncbi:hypothetical protein ACWDWO_07415 [Actinopolymorpha singaporensis]|uniref:ParB-like nuclease domain-containing protein n=1 Tax=Actinopolymorpha singaporensis TaxID=117157 RepID=A0A1H1RGV4_9ACTN|nr:hypothetical protein [Actinopolymorpha singaporensis]SDS34920.1 hypothetical protein SAMN04489717_2412 [Actinopolymorpha singaporensis]
MPTVRRPFPLLDLVPSVLREVILDFHWEPERLWRSELQPVMVPTAEIEWHLRLPLWAYDGQPFAVSPLEVAADPERYHEQYARTMVADLGCPLHFLDRPGGLTVLDGAHRLLKASLSGHEHVMVKKVPMDLLDEIVVR